MIALISIATILVDQYSKKLALSSDKNPLINRGIAFGLFKNNLFARLTYSGAWFSVAYFIWKAGYGGLATGLVIGGTVSNLIDHFTRKGVIDWIKYPLSRFGTNLADIAVGIGIMIALSNYLDR